MAREERALETSQTQRSWLRHRLVIGAISIVVFVVLLVLGPRLLAMWSRHMASREMDAWAISAAQGWLARAASLNPSDGRTDLMQAACYRRLDQMDRWSEALESAKQKGAPATPTQQEIKLGLIRSGQFNQDDELRLGELIEAGVSTHDVAAAFVHGYLVRGDRDKAKLLLDNWETTYPNEAHVAYMRGFYWYQSEESVPAMVNFEDTLAKQPRHEPARRAVAQLCETGDRLDRALEHFIEFSNRSPADTGAKMGLARILRKLGRVHHARRGLDSLTSHPAPPSDVATEMAQIELESGNYEEAERWYGRANLDETEDAETLSIAATAFALNGNAAGAERLFARSTATMSASTRMYDLEVLLAINPSDKNAVDELRRLSGLSNTVSADVQGHVTKRPPSDSLGSPAASGRDLYAQHCSACHGANGNGDGRAARHLSPRPRDFRTERFRLVSAVNGVPTLDDVKAVTKRGMPGASMPAFENLSEEQHRLLAQEVLRLHREGVRSRFIDMLKNEGEDIDENEVNQVVEAVTCPAEVLGVPQIGPLDPQAVARGKELYSQLGCSKCHGNDGTGAHDTHSFDGIGRPTRARDLVREPFKGGQEPEAVYLRIALGMPGSPHPASRTLSEEQLIDLVHFCRSLSQEPKRLLTNHQRSLLASGKAYFLAYGGSSTLERND